MYENKDATLVEDVCCTYKCIKFACRTHCLQTSLCVQFIHSSCNFIWKQESSLLWFIDWNSIKIGKIQHSSKKYYLFLQLAYLGYNNEKSQWCKMKIWKAKVVFVAFSLL